MKKDGNLNEVSLKFEQAEIAELDEAVLLMIAGGHQATDTRTTNVNCGPY
jgi:hypothetical protein